MQNYRIMEYGKLSDVQKEQAVHIFLEGFGHMMTFTKDENVRKALFSRILHPTLFVCYVESDHVLGIMGLATNKVRPLEFRQDICIELFGKVKGKMVSKQMNAIFQKQVIKGERELYIDVLATASSARGKGVATALLNYAFNLEAYDTYYIEVFSKNETATRLYKKVGFEIYKEEKFSPLFFLGSGYPVKMKKNVFSD